MTRKFALLKEQNIPELNATVRYYVHKKTGARLLSVINDDENKVFSINFRTPPKDSTGVAHILEHSVLNGSEKYPVKEPFVELLKGSLATFVNAITYPDKTCYPVASQNVQDFYNLIDVYLDAVFHPLISEQTLMQEGWHYELNDKVVMDENSPFRANAIRAIGNIRPPFIPAKSNLVEFVGDRKAEHDLRWQATIGLGEMKLADQETIGVLCNALSDPDPELRWKSIEALSKFQQEAAPYEDLAKATKDKDWRVRIGAAHALSYMGSISIPVLISMLSVDDATVSVETIRVLGAMGHEADSAVAALVKTMKWPLEGVPEDTIEALKKIGTPSASEALSASNR